MVDRETLTDRILVVEPQPQAGDLALVDGIVIEHLDIEKPLLEVFGRDEFDARRQMAFDLGRCMSQVELDMMRGPCVLS